MKHILIGLILGSLFVGCTNFSTNVWRTEQTAVSLVYTAYQGYTNGMNAGVIHVDPTNQAAIKRARLEFSASVNTVENFRAAYETNSALQPQVQASLNSAMLSSSNVVYLIHLFTN